MEKNSEYCFQCGGLLVSHRVTKIQTWRGDLVGVIRNVPAWVCNQCGERYYDGPVLERIEQMLQQQSKPSRDLTVPAYEF